MMSKKQPGKLLDSSDEEEQADLSFKVNTDYANKYDDWRAKEEMQKLKDRYGDEPASASSSSESEDEDAEALTPAIERDFFKTLAVLKSKDPGVYDKNRKFFAEESDPATSSSGKSSKPKPMFLKDYERKVITEENGIIDETKNRLPPKFQSEYDREQEEAKRNLSAFVHDDSDEEDNGLLVKRKKTQEQLQQEEHDYANWFKGLKKEESKSESFSALKPLTDYWTDPSLDDGEKFLRDYLLDKKYIDKDAKRIPTYADIVDEHLSEDEADIDKAEEFEQKYNFRFEEPDQEFIKRFPRTMDDSLRRKDDSRKKKRDEIKERKEAENNRIREDIKQLKSLKRREILQKIEKLKSIAGNEDLSVGEKDLEGDFDPDTYDSMMQKAFDEKYYQNEEEMEKPELSDESDIDENWLEEREVEEKEDKDDAAEFANTSRKSGPVQGEGDEPSTSTAVPEPKGRRRRRTKVSEALQNTKPVFDPNDKKLEEYLDEYYKLDFEDVVSGIPCRFKYRSVVPNNFGLSVDEILRAPDRELNAWCSLKKTVQYRSEQEEMHDVRAFKQKGSQQELKQRIIPSLVEEEAEEKEEVQPEQKKKRRRKKKKNTENGSESVPAVNLDGSKDVKADDVETDVNSGELDTAATEAGAPSEPSSQSAKAGSTSHEKKRKRKKKSKKTPEPSAGLSNGPTNKKAKTEDYNAFLKTLPSAKISDKRLEAYGLNPKKFRQKEKYVMLSKKAGGQESKAT